MGILKERKLMDKGYLVVFDDAENYKAKAYDIDSDVKEDDAKKLAIEDYTFYKFIDANKVIYFTDKKLWNTYLKKLLDFLKAKQSEINEFQSSSFKDKQLEVITEKIKLIESVKNIEAIEVTDVNILEKINATPLFRIDKEIKEKEFENDPVCSYHTFIFPFRIIDKSNGIKRKEHDFSAYNTKEILEKEISIANDSVWKKSENYSSKESITRDEVRKQTTILDEKLFKLRYNEAQYFNDAPLRAIFGFSDEDQNQVVTNYVFNHDLIHEKAKLIIQVASENEPKEYRLVLNDIKLKLFNTDVAMMIFETENRDYPDIKDIKLINEYVRRISTPNLTIESNPCAYYWEIKFKDANGKNVCLKDDCYDALNGDLENINTTKIVDSIKQLLLYPYINENSRKDVCLSSSVEKLNKEENKNKKLYLIEPVLDDRMFVCTFIKNDAVINKVKNKYVEINGKYEELKKEEKKSKKKEPKPLFVNYKYGYQIDEEVAKELYSIVYIDATTSSCQSMHDIQALLSRDLYTRWIDYGTLYASTHHSFVAISTSDCPGYLIDYFLTLYVDMTILTLIQRATIIVYQNYASLLTKGIEADKKNITQAKLNTLLNLHEKYIGFQNQLLFFEVSPEEQGMELYQMLVKSLYINEEKDALAEQFKSLYDVTNANQNSTFSKYAAIMASIALVFTSITFIYDMFEIPQDICIRVRTVVIAIIIIVAIIWYVRNKYRRNK